MTERNKPAIFLETLRRAYPGLDIRTARLHMDGGQFNDLLFVNDDLIFWFPRYAESIPDFLRETELITQLQGHLPLPIPNPLYASQQFPVWNFHDTKSPPTNKKPT